MERKGCVANRRVQPHGAVTPRLGDRNASKIRVKQIKYKQKHHAGGGRHTRAVRGCVWCACGIESWRVVCESMRVF